MAPAPTPTDHKIADLQLLRGISILLVLIQHLSFLPKLTSLMPFKPGFAGQLGVEIFFVISGFVIVNALRRDRFEPISFFVKRIFRLTPALVCFLLISAGVVALFLNNAPKRPGEPDRESAGWKFFGDIGNARAPDFSKTIFTATIDPTMAKVRAGDSEHLDLDPAVNLEIAKRPHTEWKALEEPWKQALIAKGVPADEAAIKAAEAARAAEKDWGQVIWKEFWKQALSVIFGYYSIREAYWDPPRLNTNGAVWSLAVEDQFYAVMGLTCLLAAIFFRRRAPKVMPWILGIASALLIVAAVVVRFDFFFQGDYWGYKHTAFYYQLSDPGLFTPGVEPELGERIATKLCKIGAYLLQRHFDFLAVGIVLAFVEPRLKAKYETRLGDRGPFLALLFLGIPLILGFYIGHNFGAYYEGLLLLVSSICFAPLVMLAAWNKLLPASRSGPLAPVLKYFGDRSYTIYLLHFPLLALAWYTLYVLYPAWADSNIEKVYTWTELRGQLRFEIAQIVILLALLIPTTEVIYRFVELPLTKLGRNLAKRVRIVPADQV